MHAKISHMRVKDHVVHVRFWWIIETSKRPSTHFKVSRVFAMLQLDTK